MNNQTNINIKELVIEPHKSLKSLAIDALIEFRTGSEGIFYGINSNGEYKKLLYLDASNCLNYARNSIYDYIDNDEDRYIMAIAEIIQEELEV